MIKKVILVTAVATGTACWESTPRTTNDPPANYQSEPIANRATNLNTNLEKTPLTNSNSSAKTRFAANLPDSFEQPTDDVGRKLLREYGSVFIARGGALPPTKVVYLDEADVSRMQSALGKTSATIGGHSLELQTAAMSALQDAIKAAQAKNLKITPRGPDSAKRTYTETVGLWNSRVDPALKHWVGKGKLTQADADKIKAMSTFEQVSEVLKLEEKGIFFAKDLSKSIIYSVAPPGTSQHLSMLAFDVMEHDNAAVRTILAENGWFQTVASDLPHFTFLGVKESELSALGLKQTTSGGRTFWVPDI